MVNKRNFNRFKVNKKIKLIKNNNEEFFGVMDDISLKGMAVILDNASFLSGDKFCFRIEFADIDEVFISGECEVMGENDKKYNLRFVSIDENYFDNLRRLIEVVYG